MTLADILDGLFPGGHDIALRQDHLILGTGRRANGGPVTVIGIADGEPLGIAGVLPLAKRVLDVVTAGGDTPILVMVDTQGQRMARQDEMLGLNEYLAHLAKCLRLATLKGHPTVGLNYGKAAAGAFLATALATDVLVALPDAEPAVMDLPSVARVTKLPEDKLRELAQTTSVFAPGLRSMIEVGAVAATWDQTKSFAEQFEATLACVDDEDRRDLVGARRGGRRMAARVARRVVAQASGEHHGRAELGRHALLRVAPEGWRATLAADGLHALDYDQRRLVVDWATRGWPLIVRRPVTTETAGGISVGLPLPPALGKLRLCFVITWDIVAAMVPTVPLRPVLGTAPRHLRPQLEAALALEAQLSTETSVFGALLWQHLTGLPYLADAVALHRWFVARRLSPGGAADLLAATIFLDSLESGL